MRDVAGLFVTKGKTVPRTLLVFKELHWFFPGGKRELNESIEEALARELREELSLQLTALPQLIHIGEFPAIGGQEYRFHTYRCPAEMLAGSCCLNPLDSVKDFAWVDEPLCLNLTEHARFVIESFG